MVYDEEKVILGLSLYIASFVGDLFDGIAARKFNQCSKFGGENIYYSFMLFVSIFSCSVIHVWK